MAKNISFPNMGILSNVRNLPVNPQILAESSLTMLVGAWSDYKKTAEVESTKRAAISAWRDKNVTQLENQREFLEKYLAETFRERAGVISQFFDRLDRGIEDNNPELINAAITGIVDIAKESPLKNVSAILSAIDDPQVTMIEI